MEPDGQTFSQIPQPVQASVTRKNAQKVLPCVRGHLLHPRQKLAVGLAVSLCDRRDHMLAFVQIGEDGRHLAFYVLIEFLLFLHVEARQPVIHHLDDVDVVHGHAAFIAQPLGQLCCAAVAVAIGQKDIEIAGMKNRPAQKFLNHRRHFMAVDGRDDADALRRKFQFLPAHGLGNAHRVWLDLFGDIKAVSGGGEIEYHAASAPFPCNRAADVL